MSGRAEKRIRAVLGLTQGTPVYVLDLMVATGLSAGRIYPVLARLEREGVVESFWAEGPEPRRRMYVTTYRANPSTSTPAEQGL